MADLIRFAGDFKVYDISDGTFKHLDMTAEEFTKAGYKWENVREIDKSKVGLNRQEDQDEVYANIDGKKVHVQDLGTFNSIGFGWKDVQITGPPTPTGPKLEANLIRFTTSPYVYNIQNGKLEHITAEDFNTKGYNPKDIKLIDPLTSSVKKDEAGKVTITIDGQDIWIENMATFDKTGISRSIFLEDGKPVTDLRVMHNEIKNKTNLQEIWNDDPALQTLFHSPETGGQGRAGNEAEGFNIEVWAMRNWQLYPDKLAAYSPENLVRVAYWSSLRGEDPFAAATYDPEAQSWVDAIKRGEITTFDSLVGRIQTDKGNEWNSLSKEQQDAITIDANIDPEELAKLPKFSEFFKKEEERKEAEDWAREYYDKELSDFLEAQGVKEARAIEDATRLLGELTEDEERDLTDLQKTFRLSLKSANEGYGRAGLIFGTERREAERLARGGLAAGREKIQLLTKRGKQEAIRTKERTLEDIERAEERAKEKAERLKITEAEQRFTQARAEKLALYEAAKAGVLEPEEVFGEKPL